MDTTTNTKPSLGQCLSATDAIDNVLRHLHPHLIFAINPGNDAIAVQVEGTWVPQIAMMIGNWGWAPCPHVAVDGKPAYSEWSEYPAKEEA